MRGAVDAHGGEAVLFRKLRRRRHAGTPFGHHRHGVFGGFSDDGNHFRTGINNHLPLHPGGDHFPNQQGRVDLFAIEIEVDLALPQFQRVPEREKFFTGKTLCEP